MNLGELVTSGSLYDPIVALPVRSSVKGRQCGLPSTGSDSLSFGDGIIRIKGGREGLCTMILLRSDEKGDLVIS